jgi:hypothetical protein
MVDEPQNSPLLHHQPTIAFNLEHNIDLGDRFCKTALTPRIEELMRYGKYSLHLNH